jgi:hypothetical protein
MRAVAALVVMLIFTADAAFGQQADSDVATKWFAVGKDEAGLAVLWKSDEKPPPTLSLMDGLARKMSSVTWDVPTPLVAQYRLKPGTYQFVVNGSTRSVNLSPGKLTYLDLGGKLDPWTTSSEISGAKRAEISSFVGGFLASSNLAAPISVQPKGYALYFNTDPPFEIPRPRPLPPDGEPKPK